jgi:ATP-binding cassette, subfamily A (ABC1), member 3
MIAYIVQEKQLRQKELLKMMSVVESDIGWAWFSTFASFNIISAICAAVVSTVLYEHSSFSLLATFWILSILATTVYCMTMSTFTSKTSRAVLIGLLVYFSGVFFTIAVDYRTGNPAAIALICLHPAAAFGYGIKILGFLEDREIGLVHSSLRYSDGNSELSMSNILQYLCIDVIIWGLLSWYFNRIMVPDFGQALPFWFPFDVSYWFPRRRPDSNIEEDPCSSTSSGELSSAIPVEPVSDVLKGQAERGKSIEIHSLRKAYGDTIAVDGLNLSIYSGQVTALLGHNGTFGSRLVLMIGNTNLYSFFVVLLLS